MAKIVFISNYLRGGKSSKHLANRTNYFATREGVDILPDDSNREKYLDYVSMRPGVKKMGAEHGLFDVNGKVKNLYAAVREVSDYPGVVWTPIVSLPREEADRLGYNTAEAWQMLINSCTAEIAEGYKIPLDKLRWYAAMHEKEKHIHVHMLVFSADPSKGYLTEQGIEKVKSAFARTIYADDLIPIYKEQTERRTQLQGDAEERMLSLIKEMEQGKLNDPKLEQLILELSNGLSSTKGKKVYGYLKPELKNLVDEIVDELAKDVRVAQAYSLWYDLREAVINTYTDNIPERLPLSQQKELKSVRNMVIREVLKMNMDMYDTVGENKELPTYTIPPLPELKYAAQESNNRDEEAPLPKQGIASKHEQKAPAVTECAVRMLYHMGRIFREQTGTDTIQSGLRIDKKRRRELMEKRIALGHRPDDHEDYMMKM